MRIAALAFSVLLVFTLCAVASCGAPPPQMPTSTVSPKPSAVPASPSAASPTPGTAPAISPTPTTTAVSPAPATGELTLEFVDFTKTSFPGGDAKITVKTTAGAKCVLDVVLPETGTHSRYPDDKEHSADAGGLTSWTWTYSERTKLGDSNVEVTASLGGKSISKSVTIVIKMPA